MNAITVTVPLWVVAVFMLLILVQNFCLWQSARCQRELFAMYFRAQYGEDFGAPHTEGTR